MFSSPMDSSVNLARAKDPHRAYCHSMTPTSPQAPPAGDNSGGSETLEVLYAQHASRPQGLGAAEAAARLVSHGPNRVQDEQSLGPLRLAAHQFESPLVLILVFAALVALLLGEWIESFIIIAIVLGSTALGFAQEYRASSAVARLRGQLALKVRALRDGVIVPVTVTDIVPGDVVVLSAGNLVPADGRVFEAGDFLVSEASLTGESFPVEKSPGVVPAGTPLARRSNYVFLGTSVRSGTARVLITATGRDTALGGIAGRLRATPPETEFARGVRQFGILLVRMMVVIVLFVLTTNYALGRPVLDSLLFAVALAVGLSPELLPAIISVTLAAGARTMAVRGVIVRRLEAIENLGSMNILCTDKTGTLTTGVMTVHAALDADGVESPAVLELACVNAALETGIENPLDEALMATGKARGLTTEGWRKVDEIPYDFIRRRLTIVVAHGPGDGRLLITKGAVEEILDVCTTVAVAAGTRELDAAARLGFRARAQALGAQGHRVLALATREVPLRPDYDHGDESALTLRGLISFIDPPKDDAAATLGRLSALGVKTKIVTGDNRHVAAFVAARVGLDPTAILLGEGIDAMTAEAFWQRAERTDLFAEIDPQQKERIVRALQKRGHAVGYLGDGINDAPALHAADVGISVSGAVDVARESADVLLLQPDLDVLCQGVRDGRRTFANTLKYIGITTSANFGNMLSMALVTPLLNNFLSDLPSMAIASDSVDAQQTAQPTRWNVAELRRYMIVFGLVSSAFDLLTFLVLIKVFGTGPESFHTAWFVVSLLTELAVVMVLRTHGPCWRSRPGRLLWISTLLVAALSLALPWMGPVATLFGLVPMSAPLLVTLLAIVVGYIVATEIAKLVFYRTLRPRPAQ
jgi:P-type Mg2+ transporter